MAPLAVLTIAITTILIQTAPCCDAFEDATVDGISGINNRRLDLTTPMARLQGSMKCVCPEAVVPPRETVRKTTHSNNERNTIGERREIRRREEDYWIVPPFLIGASSVFVVYATVQCIYIHCYGKKKMAGNPPTNGRRSHGVTDAARLPAMLPTIIINDDPSTSSYTPSFMPMMSYNGPRHNSTGSVFSDDDAEARPFLLSPETTGAQSEQFDSRRYSLHLVVPHEMSSVPRSSICSAGPVLENSSGSGELRAHRGSICYVPVGHAFSVPPHNDYSFPQGFLFARNTSYRQACTTENASECEQMPPLAPMFVAHYVPGFKPDDEDVLINVPPPPQQDVTNPNTTEYAGHTIASMQLEIGSESPNQHDSCNIMLKASNTDPLLCLSTA